MERLQKVLRNMPTEWGKVASRSRSRSRSRSPRAAAPAARKTMRQRKQEDLQRQWARMNAIFAKPEKGDLIFDPSDPENPEKHLVYTGRDWVQAVDPFGEYGGPYMDERELLGNPKYRAEKRELNALEAEAAGVSLPKKVFAEYLAKVPAEKRAEAEAAAAPKYAAALEAAAKEAGGADLMRDEIKLGAKARRAFKGYVPEDAAPAARQKKKGGGSRAATGHGGGGRSRKARRASRKGRRASRKH